MDRILSDILRSRILLRLSRCQCVQSLRFRFISRNRIRYEDGAPVPLDAILATKFFHFQVTKTVKRTPHSLDLLDENGEQVPFPLLSQGDHPTLNTPCWFLHPCETPTAMAELLRELSSPHSPVDWLDSWLALISTVLDLRT